MRRNSNKNEIYIFIFKLRSVDENRQAPLLSQRPGYLEAKEKLRNLQKERREHFALFSQKGERKRIHNKIDPSLQGYLEWLSTNWAQNSSQMNIISHPHHPTGHQVHPGGARLHGLRTGKDGINTVGRTITGQSNDE